MEKCWSFWGLDKVEYDIVYNIYFSLDCSSLCLIFIINKIFYSIGLSKGHGFYFESNSFHRISLTELTIWVDLIEGLIPYIEAMKSIIAHKNEKDQSLLNTFLNIIVLKNKLFN